MYLIIEWPDQTPNVHVILDGLREIIRALSTGQIEGEYEGMIWRIGPSDE